MLGHLVGALALEMPHPKIVHPGGFAGLQALEAEVRILIVTKHIILGEAAELFEPGAFHLDEGAGDGGYRPRLRELRRPKRRTLAIMLDTNQISMSNAFMGGTNADIHIEIHAAVHQRAIVIAQR